MPGKNNNIPDSKSKPLDSSAFSQYVGFIVSMGGNYSFYPQTGHFDEIWRYNSLDKKFHLEYTVIDVKILKTQQILMDFTYVHNNRTQPAESDNYMVMVNESPDYKNTDEEGLVLPIYNDLIYTLQINGGEPFEIVHSIMDYVFVALPPDEVEFLITDTLYKEEPDEKGEE